MFHTDRAIIVEGKYDQIRLSALTDALIVTTDGFGIFSDKEKQCYIRTLAKQKGLLILTDSDAAGFQIRNYVLKIARNADVVNAYIPDVYGKEKRKEAPSKEGKLGVEGMDTAALTQALKQSGFFSESDEKPQDAITTADLYAAGLTGAEGAAEKRRELLRSCGLPARLSGSMMLKTLNAFFSKESFYEATAKLDPGNDAQKQPL